MSTQLRPVYELQRMVSFPTDTRNSCPEPYLWYGRKTYHTLEFVWHSENAN
jgi:hypothetical protein